jgi:hypothetical protein
MVVVWAFEANVYEIGIKERSTTALPMDENQYQWIDGGYYA